MENNELTLKDGCKTIFLSTKGVNDYEVSKSLIKFLQFVRADLSESTNDFDDEFVARLQESIQHVKESREMEERYMLFQELLRDERAQGRTEGSIEGRANSILLLLEDKGVISKDIQNKILNEKDIEVLDKWVKLAANVGSVNQFIKEMQF